ncbi:MULTISPECIES: hypothetical protein [Bacillus cereus group]|uniref:CagE, TrbE, VirB, component of type IV transporter system family protein n=1 Tax=Bacillus cereus 03BB108 TaxID=451709 RepID=A0AAN0SQR5_BACCE|nr:MULTISPECIES: hypothetical protein [Bacillus cereus group]HDR7252874.1 hypothetical protein [Bacillus pacificus]AJI08735.1 cagE, TrbE, VirB, component of type IV transporter system family protein [Bacillus cereus 03BB108]EDX59798.1 conserved hypothetical protein [Bacillus cereus 03BB108]MBF8119037.1 hypothetical protein [Bacillus cereus]MCC2357648.1 hypothetical protein [Bacillus paranthracis]
MGLFKRKKKKVESTENEQQKERIEEQKEFEKVRKNEESSFMQNVPNYIDLISPEGIAIKAEDYGKIKQSLGTETYFRPMYIPRDGYPRKLKTNWINNILSMGEIDVVFDIHKVKKNEAIRLLQRQETTFRSNLSWQNKKGNIDQISDLQTKIADCNALMEEIQFNENDMYNVSSHVVLYETSKNGLDKSSEFLEDALSALSIKLTTAYSRIKKGYLSALPFGQNHLRDATRNIDRRALSTFSPFISGSGRYHGGIPYGINRITGQKEFINSFGDELYRPDNYNMGFFGVSGSGKSLAMKLKISREMPLANVYAGIIDPEGGATRS